MATIVTSLDGALHIPDEKSISMVYQLLDTEGLYVGASSALNVVAAVELAQSIGKGRLCVPSITDQSHSDGSRF